jgi:hypothetical protein
MLWLPSHEKIDDGLKSGINTFCANGGSLSKKDYLDQLARNGLYGIVHFHDDDLFQATRRRAETHPV